MANYKFGPNDDGSGSRTYIDIDSGDIVVIDDNSRTIRRL